MTHFDAILALLLSPFIACVAIAIACAVSYVARIERHQPYFSPQTDAARRRLHDEAERSGL